MATTVTAERKGRRRVLDPTARVSEVLFGVIMALTFTGTLSAAEAGRAEIRALLLGALGCNIAWGLVDAVMYLVTTLTERGHDLVTVRAVRAAGTTADAHRIIGDAVSPMMAGLLTSDDIERVRQHLLDLPSVPARPSLTADDWRGAVGVFLLVVLSTLPLVVPFVILTDPVAAIRASHAVAILLLFAGGAMLARVGGYRPVVTGISMAALGIVLAALAIALGG